MKEIPFPSQYKKSLLNETKNSTIRVKDEVGKYKEGEIYWAKSYSGRDWGIKLRITEVIKTTLHDLPNHNIPKQSIRAIRKNQNISNNTKIELIRFIII